MNNRQAVSYSIVRSRRKTVAIYIKKDATVEVRVPMFTSRTAIDEFVAAKEKWITGHMDKYERRNAARSAFTLNYGDMLMLRGGMYPIRASDDGRTGFDGDRFLVPPGLPPESIKASIISVYKDLAKYVLTEKTAYYAERLGVIPAAVKISSAKMRWGSCSGKNSISYSWLLIMADDSAIDYVVVHELAHIRESNHSARFWDVVEGALPDYKRRKKRLHALQDKLFLEDWR